MGYMGKRSKKQYYALTESLLIKSQALFERKIKMFFGKNKHNKRATVNSRLKNRRGGVLFGLRLRS